MIKTLPPYLLALNPEQREAVFHWGSPLLILAGAGSGKTRVITTKIAYLIREKGMDPRSILALTFTNKAAGEMAERARLIEEAAAGVMIRTFHSLGAWFLRRNGAAADLNPKFVIYDDDDALSLLGTIMEDVPRLELRHLVQQISRAKDYFLCPDDPDLDLINYRPGFRKAYARYEKRMAEIGNVDFGDLIKKPVEILRAFPEIARRFHDRFKVILVDEYQDSNVAQFALLKELAGPGTYICVVGDDDQSIYRFRGAEVRNILEFPERFPGTAIVRLESNYRSCSPILALASSVVDHNTGRLGKTLRSERGDGQPPVLAFLPDQESEAAFCANLIKKSGNPLADWAVLYRTNAQSLGFETEFLRRHIPYRVVGSLKFYEREEIKDALALLALLVNPRDEVAFRRVVNKPARGVGGATVDRIVIEAAGGGSLIRAARKLMPSLGAKAREGLAVFLAALDHARLAIAPPGDSEIPGGGGDTGETDAAGGGDLPPEPGVLDFGSPAEAGRFDGAAARVPPASPVPPAAPASPAKKGKAGKTGGKDKGKDGELLRYDEGLSRCVVLLVQETGIAGYHQLRDDVQGNQRAANLQELANAASLYPASEEGLLQFLEHIELDRSIAEEDGPSGDVVTLITLHNTKGLEFRRVIMTGLEQGIFPREDKKGDDLEEERRLFYVGATRAMDELYLCSCARRRLYGNSQTLGPSLFLHEIDPACLTVLGEAPAGFISSSPGGGKGEAYGGGTRNRSPGEPKRTADGRWRIGDRLFHDDYGYGGVAAIWQSEDGSMVEAHFETGREVRFLSEFQSSRFMKIGGDD